MDQLPLIDVAAEPLPEMPPPCKEIFLVAAFHSQSRWWKIHRSSGNEEYLTYAEAEKEGRKLPGCWTNLRVLRVVLE